MDIDDNNDDGGEELTTGQALSDAWDSFEETGDDDGGDQGGGEGGEGLGDGDGPGDSLLSGDGDGDGADGDVVDDDEAAGASGRGDAGDGEGDQGSDEFAEPPVGLSATAREVWKDTPKEVRGEFARREREFAQGIQRYAENAKRAMSMDKALQPFQQYLHTNGGPAQAIGSLLSTATLLQSGSPNQRAQMVAKVIQDFGVDLPTLDAILSNTELPQGQQGGDPNIQHAIEQAIAPYKQFMQQQQQVQQQVQQRGQQQIVSEIDQFAADPNHEFYKDVRLDMADILDMAANRNMQMTLEEAYDRACKLNPEISTLLEARQRSKNLANKKKASVSISGGPSGNDTNAEPETVADALSQAWDNAGRV